MTNLRRPTLLISGIAEGFGVGLARTFAKAGHDIIGLARSERVAEEAAATVHEQAGTYTHISCDITEPEQLADALGSHADRIDHVAHNAHALLIKPFTETSEADFERIWRTTCFGAMAVSKIILPHMIARGNGTMIFSGATAGTRGGARFSAFASAKFALRGFTQSLAREVGPSGVHIAHVILDGLIDEPQTEQRFGPQDVDTLDSGEQKSKRLDPDAIAHTYLHLVQQHSSAWTHEVDLRPFCEQF